MENFNKLINAWLLSLGYVETFRANNPPEGCAEVHFIKSGIRVVCVKKDEEEYAYLQTDIDIDDDILLALKSAKIEIGSPKVADVFVKMAEIKMHLC